MPKLKNQQGTVDFSFDLNAWLETFQAVGININLRYMISVLC